MDKHLVRRLVILAAFLSVLFGGLYGWHLFVAGKIRQAIAGRGPQAVTVSAAPVRRTDWASELSATASLVAVQGTTLSPELAGTVTDIRFESGATVQKGELLVQLNDATQRAALEKDESAVALAKAKLAQQRKLIKQHNTSSLALQEAESAYAQAQAAVASDHATIAKLQIRAPFTGHLGLRRVSLGQYVDASTPVVDLQQWDPIYADFQIPQQQLSRLATGQTVTLTVPDVAEGGITGKITAVGAQVETGTRNVPVRATVDNGDGRLRPGMFGQVTIQTGQPNQVLVVPDSAIAYNTYGQYVFVLEKGGDGLVARERNVQTGDSRNGLTVVTRGLTAGDRVVTEGRIKLHPGAPVTVASETAASHPANEPEDGS